MVAKLAQAFLKRFQEHMSRMPLVQRRLGHDPGQGALEFFAPALRLAVSPRSSRSAFSAFFDLLTMSSVLCVGARC